MKTKIKGIITVFLVFMILMLLMSMKLVFASDERVIKLGVSDISDRGQSAVFFGHYQQTSLGKSEPAYGVEGIDWIKSDTAVENGKGPYYSIDPIKWIVLSKGEKNIFLFSQKILDSRKYHNDYERVTWEKTTMRSWLNGYKAEENTGSENGISYISNNFISSAFYADEIELINDARVANSNYETYWGLTGGNDTTDKVFLLSYPEVNNTNYGFDGDYSVKSPLRQGSGSEYVIGVGYMDNWWLRSPGTKYYVEAAFVYGNGIVVPGGTSVYHGTLGVRPAIKLNPEDILFTSGTSSGYTLTFKDENRNFAIVDKSEKELFAGDSLSLEYTDAKTGTFEYISAILVNPANEVISYTQLLQPEFESGKVTFNVPAGIKPGEYTLRIFNEKYIGEQKTNYSSAFSDIAVKIVNKFEILSSSETESGHSAVVSIRVPGTYTLIFANYENNRLNDVDTVEVTINDPGTFSIPSEKNISLSYGDKIMLWDDMAKLTSLCNAYTLP